MVILLKGSLFLQNIVLISELALHRFPDTGKVTFYKYVRRILGLAITSVRTVLSQYFESHLI